MSDLFEYMYILFILNVTFILCHFVYTMYLCRYLRLTIFKISKSNLMLATAAQKN